MHRNGVYIPQLRLPNPRVRVVQPPLRKLPHQRRSPVANDVSDSEAEFISEADRDARLA